MTKSVVKDLIPLSQTARQIGLRIPVAVENETYAQHVGSADREESFLREAYVHLLGASLSNQRSGWFLSEKNNGDIVEVPFTRDATGFMIGNQPSTHSRVA